MLLRRLFPCFDFPVFGLNVFFAFSFVLFHIMIYSLYSITFANCGTRELFFIYTFIVLINRVEKQENTEIKIKKEMNPFVKKKKLLSLSPGSPALCRG